MEKNPVQAVDQVSEIKFHVQNEEHSVKTTQMTPTTTLNDYLRNVSHLTGTKSMCYEGGCGACIVSVEKTDPVSGRTDMFAVNSCLVSIFSCHGWKIQTIEGIGNPLIAYHPIQKALAHFNGSQCGFCSPGMVMNLYPLFEKGNMTMEEVENSFGGNMCRCTGYRPILTAFKSLCKDADPKYLGTYPDIEDILQYKRCPLRQIAKHTKQNYCLFFDVGDSRWIKLYTLDALLAVIKQNINSNYMLVMGNTAKGVARPAILPDVYIDISDVRELLNYTVEEDLLILGANMTLNKTVALFYEMGKNNKNFSYLTKLAEHIDLVANVPVRNIGSLAGNLMIKYRLNEFDSDIFLVLETAGAQLTLIDTNKRETKLTPQDFLSFNMKGQVIKNIMLPSRDDTYKYGSYKIMMRAQNTHAMVNAGFLFKFNNNIVQKATIVYGNINRYFLHARAAETYLNGKNLFNNQTLQGTYQILNDEVTAEEDPPEAPAEFRKQCAIALFYKFVLSMAPDNSVNPKYRSGAQILVRPLSYGTQDFATNQSVYPLTQPITKLEALAQTSGGAEFIYDIPDLPDQLHGALVLAKIRPNSVIKDIDTSDALKVKNVVAFFDKNDIPGKNTFTPSEVNFTISEELFCSGTVQYFNQPVGLIVGRTLDAALTAADLVKITYDGSKQKPLLTVREILAAKDTKKIQHVKTIQPSRKGNDVKHVIKGTFDISWQYHYHMETQCCNIVPKEDGLDIYASTQWMNLAQAAAAAALNIPNNKINVVVRRLGGAYGAKISRNSLVSTAGAIAAYKLRKPVKIWMPFTTNMDVIGKRFPCYCDYEIGVDDDGVIQYLNNTFYSDQGAGGNEPPVDDILSIFTKKYNTETWYINANTTTTDNPAGTWCRAPGTTEGLAMIESMMDHISYTVKKDPLQVRLANFKKDDDKMRYFVSELSKWADIDNRKKTIDSFNAENRWIKKGFSVVPMAYGFQIAGNFTVMVSIYQADGTVAISHGGIEMGQGINTKAAQVCAYALGIPLDYVSVKPSNNMVGANSATSGGSIASEAVCYGTLQACQILLDRIKPYKEQMKDATWPQLIKKCFNEYVDLAATYMYSPKSPKIENYIIYGVCATEIQVDILTGCTEISRVDLLEDTGNSMSPEIDVGQVEGAFIMGLGYWTTEKLVYSDDGALLTNRTWYYTPPCSRDIPTDFRVKFPKNNPNPVGVLKSKATAEPPLCLACSIPLAIRHAVASARADSGKTGELFYPFEGPSTVDNTFMNSLNDYKQYLL